MLQSVTIADDITLWFNYFGMIPGLFMKTQNEIIGGADKNEPEVKEKGKKRRPVVKQPKKEVELSANELTDEVILKSSSFIFDWVHVIYC